MCKPWEYSWGTEAQIPPCHSEFCKSSISSQSGLNWFSSNKPARGLCTGSLVMLQEVILIYLCGQVVKINLDPQTEFRQTPGSELERTPLFMTWTRPQTCSRQDHDEVWVGSLNYWVWAHPCCGLFSSAMQSFDGFNCKYGLCSCAFDCVSFKLSCKFSGMRIIQSETPARMLDFSSQTRGFSSLKIKTSRCQQVPWEITWEIGTGRLSCREKQFYAETLHQRLESAFCRNL